MLIVPLQNEFGWSRATIGFAISVNLIFYGLGGPFAAGLVERFGMRRVTIGALLGVSAGSSLTVFMDAPWQLDLLWGVVNGLATGAVAVPLAAMIANRWFVERRGLVTGVLTASTATGNLIFLPALAAITDAWGWRYTAVTVSVVAFARRAAARRAAPARPPRRPRPRRRSAAREIEPAPARRAATRSPPRSSGSRAARHSRDFWLLAGSFFICGLSTNGLIGTHLIPAAMDHGYGEVAAAGLLATIGVFDIIGTTCSGWLTDRHDPRVLLFWYYGLRGLSLLALPYVFGSSHFGLILFIVFYGLDWIATVPPTVALTAEIFGRERVGVIFGWIFCSHMFGAAAAAWAAGAVRTWFGGYGWAFGTAGLLCLFASGLVLQINRASRPLVARTGSPT